MYKILGAILLAPTLALAQIQPFNMKIFCGSTEYVLDELKKYKEKLVLVAKETDDTTITIWKNEENQTFTVLKTSASGTTTCLISSGKIFTPI